ncbi:hypothetical protein ABVT39_007927 [Epinephelus coioides]
MPILTTSVFKKRRQRPHISRFRLWRYCIMALFLLFTPQPSCGLIIFSSSVSPTYAAVGESVTLTCLFKLAPEDLGVLDIQWSIRPADISQDEILVVWYAGNHIYDNYDPFGHRVKFVSPNPASGNASKRITDLKMTDTNTYECKVRKLPGIRSSIIHLDVMKKPTKPDCHVEGVVELDRRVLLRCRGTQGSPPIWYRWSMYGTEKSLPFDSTVDSTQGDLSLTITKEVAPGTLVCTAQNLVGMKSCQVDLRLKTSPGVTITVAVMGATVFIIIITAIIVFFYKRRKVENSGNEILEDQLPPHKWLPKKAFHQAVPSGFAPCARKEIKIKAQWKQKEKEEEDVYETMESTQK